MREPGRHRLSVSFGVGSPHPALRATFSPGEKGPPEGRLMTAARYVALNPVRARLVKRAEDWRWSSVAAHLAERDDGLVSVAPLLDRCAGRFVVLFLVLDPILGAAVAANGPFPERRAS